jgi:hypothetical protein
MSTMMAQAGACLAAQADRLPDERQPAHQGDACFADPSDRWSWSEAKKRANAIHPIEVIAARGFRKSEVAEKGLDKTARHP